MRTMGIDASLANTGICIYDWSTPRVFGEVLHTETVGHSIPKDGDVLDKVNRILTITKRIVALHREYKPNAVLMEGPSLASKFSRHYDLGGLNYNIIVQLWLTHKILVEVVPPKTARKRGLGSGAPPKVYPGKGQARTKRWVKEKLLEITPHAPSNEHTRDALVLCLADQGFRA